MRLLEVIVCDEREAKLAVAGGAGRLVGRRSLRWRPHSAAGHRRSGGARGQRAGARYRAPACT